MISFGQERNFNFLFEINQSNQIPVIYEKSCNQKTGHVATNYQHLIELDIQAPSGKSLVSIAIKTLLMSQNKETISGENKF